MKRKSFIKHLYDNGCVFVRGGAKHSVFFNTLTRRSSTVPRHNELNNDLVKKICQDLGIKPVNKK